MAQSTSPRAKPARPTSPKETVAGASSLDWATLSGIRPLSLLCLLLGRSTSASKVRGIPPGLCIDVLCDDEEAALIRDLQRGIAELRATPKEVAPGFAITNSLGTTCFDYRINAGLHCDADRGSFVGPFVDEDESNKTLMVGALPNVSHRAGHRNHIYPRRPEHAERPHA
ncbi:hypothetical protein UVI_02044770 [Ustilaginoidea virens]|uniref:Uncharacterized protein n=1 Tax=Ustilaginoidea virens TaxID=1159556 RepID=A0A1B5L2R8_USTVR|nr:hypothetical protein UVI_02044770 [Ustilaginoidea virens]